jgi:hypothetical protein
MTPLEAEHFARTESREHSHVQQKLLPQFDSSQAAFTSSTDMARVAPFGACFGV